MQKIIIKGGYGEHGRSCFMVEYIPNHYCMVDCGILDTDSNPYPNLTKEEIERVDYLFLTHTHKDHTGAVNKIIEEGFKGMIIASLETIDFTGIEYPKIFYVHSYNRKIALDYLTFMSGRSGHCPGSLWFYLELETKEKYLFTGDYEENTLVTICDKIRNIEADIAFVDNAHDTCNEDAYSLRDKLKICIEEALNQNRKVVLPLQKYGRSAEILVLLNQYFPGKKIALSKDIKKALLKALEYNDWISEKDHELLNKIVSSCVENMKEADLIMLGDTHLEKQESIELVHELLEEKALVISTGRKKQGSYMAKLIDDHIAIKMTYPHHSSRLDAKNLCEQNQFDIVLPFHTDTKEVWINKQK